MVRSIQRIRSKSLTSANDPKQQQWAGRHPTESNKSHQHQNLQQLSLSSPEAVVDDLHVGRKRGSLLCGFPPLPPVATHSETEVDAIKRVSLLRGFDPQPALGTEEEEHECFFTAAIRGWIG